MQKSKRKACCRKARSNWQLNKPVIMANLKGKVAKAPSITEFAAKHLPRVPNAKFHIGAVLRGERLHHHGWHLPVIRLPMEMIHVDGRQMPVGDWISTAKRLRLQFGKLSKLMRGGLMYYRGWRLKGTPPPKPPRPHFRYQVRSPRGRLHSFTNHSAFARRHAPRHDRTGLHHLTSGKSGTWLGWTLEKVEQLI